MATDRTDGTVLDVGILQTLEGEIYDNVAGWGLAALLAAAVLASALIARWVLLRGLSGSDAAEEQRWRALSRGLVEKTSAIFIVIAAIYAGTSLLKLPASIHQFISSAFVVALFIQLARWADLIVTAAIAWRLAPRSKVATRNALSLIEFLVRVGVWSLALLLIFDNLGFDITALVAGLGIGGVAVALAAQSVLGDLFSSLAIVLDRPFEVGDFIVFGEQKGTVEKIGVKTTRLRSLSGEQIVCANSDLLNSRIHNYKRMIERRVEFGFDVAYGTSPEKLAVIPVLLREIIEAAELTRFDRAHFKALGEHALNFEVVYFVLSSDYNTYMDVHQSVLLNIVRGLQREEIDLAYPARTLQVGLNEALNEVSGGGQPAFQTSAAKSIRRA
jgi:small-conductance mechanosensitive channel